MDYSIPISFMTWSYSRITCFEQCPYRFLLHYLLGEPQSRSFFATYGGYIHSILEKIYTGQMTPGESLEYYPIGFLAEVERNAPSQDIYNKYYQDGKIYLQFFEKPKEKILGVEQNINFSLKKGSNKYDFTGFIDLIVENSDGGYNIVDHKTRILSRSSGGKKRKCDEEFAEYCRQLYLYSIETERIYGEPPRKLVFNCFRNNSTVSTEFDKSEQEKVTEWAISTIEEIKKEKHFYANPDWFKCRNLCGFFEICEFAQ